jgi:hypothetical protein
MLLVQEVDQQWQFLKKPQSAVLPENEGISPGKRVPAILEGGSCGQAY